MTKRAIEFRELVSNLMMEGWRAYRLENVYQLEEKGAYLERNNLEILYFEKTPIFFIRDKYRRNDR